ncbi:acyl-CoA thioesterase [Mycobacterium sp. 1245111.1]|nr:thioesterase family protein [Mycobacterium sp. 1245111.1]OBK38955.1 acyl-CoA thioesterase [Mycobacterium sp. 1245111.1]
MSKAELHPLDRAIEFEVVNDEAVRGETQPEWANMVGPFGGITAAAILQAIDVHPHRLGEPVALTVNFAAPIADGDFEISRRAARTNRTNQHWIVELSQAGEVKTTATAVFGNHRDTWSDTEAAMPVVPSPDEIPRTDVTNLPTWFQMYDMRFAAGSFSGTGVEAGPSSVSTLWVRDGARRRLDFPALTALSDIFFPRIFLRRGIVPSGTISMTTYFHADSGHLEALGGDFILGTAQANRFDRGFFDQSAQLWGRDGALLATTYQIVYFKG